MLTYPNFDPVFLELGPFNLIFFQLGPLKIHWYGIMYLVGFSLAWWLGSRRANQENSAISPAQVSDIIFYGALGVVVGGRLGYTLFYDLTNFLSSPLIIFKVWQGGMSFHGGLLGVLVALGLYAYKINRQFFVVMDFVAPLVPLGLGSGRIGNFINGELWGRSTDLPWGMVFPNAVEKINGVFTNVPRHPSQLYQAALEGVALFIILWLFSKRPRPTMAVSGLFLIGYGTFRFLVEFVREPDYHLGFIVFDWMTMGQILSLPMLIAGIGLIWWAYHSDDAICT